ncbi:hypothetical protein IMG5_203050 [Ichthyophthirius multifiliis]|uniref:Phosphodiesterase n=1 Tax=Ichthyophthirius multifiliis TaxID=5932 RepID=G0R694_ICHMU|nr:hypothetical protein IMG5_203050 [Ichthyophthirius multifiliis]EGR27021.1 hypothetical protein IMG5_203050 [Ichthyophthirius multifiliis]|eukprot:XP_004023905.1 hypothetical protein IMG5_203050 [Ichthyophthirius multifiliis]
MQNHVKYNQIYFIKQEYIYNQKQYFNDKLQLLDAFIIIISIMLIIIEIKFDNITTFTNIAQIFRALFRLFRIFLLFRKVNTFKNSKIVNQIRTPAQKLIQILENLKDVFDNISIIRKFQWIIEVIQQNSLYEPQIEEKSQQQQQYQTTIVPQNILDYFNNYVFFIKGFMLYIFQMFNSFIIKKKKIKVEDISCFDCFELQKFGQGEELSYLLLFLFEKRQLINQLQIDFKIFFGFAKNIQNNYKQEAIYHSQLHAFDVTQFMHFLLIKCNFIDLAEVSPLEEAAIYISASSHDYQHPGLNNQYMINTQNNLALKYNDKSVLENFHVSKMFEDTLNNESINIFRSFTIKEFKIIRQIIINMILATDMSRHFSDIGKMKTRLDSGIFKYIIIFLFKKILDFDIKNKDKQNCMEILIHAADLSNPIKNWKISYQWSIKIMNEFFNQGDNEKQLGLPVTYLCDRDNVNIPKSQIGFIDFVVKPLFEICVSFLPELKVYLQNFDINKQQWKELENSKSFFFFFFFIIKYKGVKIYQEF